jgi:hypothetical protein
MDEISLIEQSRQLVSMLERLSADSHWAHHASGVRGALLRAIQSADDGDELPDVYHLLRLNESAREFLVRAARELLE